MRPKRPYLQGDHEAPGTSALVWLVSALIGGFLLQLMLGTRLLGGMGGGLEAMLGLSGEAVRRGWVWTLCSHAFLHSPVFLFHLVLNVLALVFLGRALVPVLGSVRFVGLFLAATAAGGLAWLPLHWRAGELVGATAGVYGLLVVFARFNPQQPLQFLVLFLFPVTLRPSHVVWMLAGFDLVALFAFEVTGNPAPFGWSAAGSAHLAGMAVGFVYHRFVHHAGWFNPEDRAGMSWPRWLRREAAASVAVASAEAAPDRPGDLRAEVDRILDKIGSAGLGSLTPAEREVLARARRNLTRS